MHVPLGELPQRLGEIDPGRTPVTVCEAGGRSARAHAFLADNGVIADDLASGMQAWQGAGLPVVASDGRPGRVI